MLNSLISNSLEKFCQKEYISITSEIYFSSLLLKFGKIYNNYENRFIFYDPQPVWLKNFF